MHYENFIIHHSANREDVKAEAKLFPYLDVVPSLTLVVEAVHSIDRLTLVITSEHVEVLWVFYFVGEQQANCLYGLFATIHIVSDVEEFLVAAWKPSNIEETEQIEVLAVHISENFDWCLQVEEHIIFGKNFGRFINKKLNSFCVEFDWFPPLLLFNFHELFNYPIQGKFLLSIGRRIWKVLVFFELIFYF